MRAVYDRVMDDLDGSVSPQRGKELFIEASFALERIEESLPPDDDDGRRRVEDDERALRERMVELFAEPAR